MFLLKRNKQFGFFLLTFLLVGGFLFFGNINNAQAQNIDPNTPTCKTGTNVFQTVQTEAECVTLCRSGSLPTCLYFYQRAITYIDRATGTTTDASAPIAAFAQTSDAGAGTPSDPHNQPPSRCSMSLWELKSLIICPLMGILGLIGSLLAAVNTLFSWSISVANMDLLTNGPAIYASWKLIRDLLNIAFILVLVYTAFTIIFQVDSSNKKIILTIVLMALLVNFSFPISRFIVSLSNSLMYTIANTLDFGSAGAINVLGTISDKTGIGSIVHPTQAEASITSLLAAIVFSFILTITLLATTILLVVRMIALGILIIFSPLAFVATIFPGSNSYSSKWWSNLFNYALFGPVMMLMLYITVQIMSGFNQVSLSGFYSEATKNSLNPNVIGSMSYMSIPIILLWLGMGTAQSMSIAGAGAVMGQAQKFAKWAGKGLYKVPYWGFKKTGIPGGVQQRYSEIKSKFKSAQDSRDARMAALLGSKSAEERDMKTRAEEYKKNKGLPELKDLAEKGDAAAAYALADMKEMTADIYAAFEKANKNPRIKKALDAKVKQNRADLVTLSKANDPDSEEYKETEAAHPTWTPDQIKDEIVETDMGKLTAEKLADQDFVSIDKKMPPGPDKARVSGAIVMAINGLALPAKSELQKRLSPANRVAINKLAGSPPAPPII